MLSCSLSVMFATFSIGNTSSALNLLTGLFFFFYWLTLHAILLQMKASHHKASTLSLPPCCQQNI